MSVTLMAGGRLAGLETRIGRARSGRLEERRRLP